MTDSPRAPELEALGDRGTDGGIMTVPRVVLRAPGLARGLVGGGLPSARWAALPVKEGANA